MAASGGSGLLLRPYVSGSPVTMAGLRTKSIALNSEPIDITNSDSVGLWKELLSTSGVRSASVSGSGVLLGQPIDRTVALAVMNGTVVQMDIVVPGLGALSGNWKATSFKGSGEYNKEIVYDVTLESSGVITLT